MVKQGLFFWVELIFLIIIVTIVALSLPKAEDGYFKTKTALQIQKTGYSALQALDQAKVLENFTSPANFAASNFTALSLYIRKGLPSTLEARIEYSNGTSCLSEAGAALSSCGNFTIVPDTVVSEYAFARLREPVTIRLYLWSVFA